MPGSGLLFQSPVFGAFARGSPRKAFMPPKSASRRRLIGRLTAATAACAAFFAVSTAGASAALTAHGQLLHLAHANANEQ